MSIGGQARHPADSTRPGSGGFAVALALNSVRIAAAPFPEPDAYGRVKPEVLVAARFERDALRGVKWKDADSISVANDASSELRLRQVRATKGLAPLDLSSEPPLNDLLAAIDYDELRS